MFDQHRKFTADIESGKLEQTGYMQPLEETSSQGKVLLVLAKAFEVSIEASTVA